MKIRVLLLWLSGFFTATAAVPAGPGGVIALIELLLVVVGWTTVWFGKTTTAPDSKFAPLIVICVPPETLPVLGTMLVIDGALTKLYPAVKVLIPLPGSLPLGREIVPVKGSMLVTTTSVAPIGPGGVVARMQGSCIPDPQSAALLVTVMVVAGVPTVPVPARALGGPPKVTSAP